MRWEVDVVDLGVSAERTADELDLRFDQRFLAHSFFESAPGLGAAFAFDHGSADQRLRYAAGAGCFDRGC